MYPNPYGALAGALAGQPAPAFEPEPQHPLTAPSRASLLMHEINTAPRVPVRGFERVPRNPYAPPPVLWLSNPPTRAQLAVRMPNLHDKNRPLMPSSYESMLAPPAEQSRLLEALRWQQALDDEQPNGKRILLRDLLLRPNGEGQMLRDLLMEPRPLRRY